MHSSAKALICLRKGDRFFTDKKPYPIIGEVPFPVLEITFSFENNIQFLYLSFGNVY